MRWSLFLGTVAVIVASTLPAAALGGDLGVMGVLLGWSVYFAAKEASSPKLSPGGSNQVPNE